MRIVYFVIFVIVSFMTCHVHATNRTADLRRNLLFDGKLIIEVGLPKSGTSSIYEGLKALGISSAHYAQDHNDCKSLLPISAVNVSSGNITTHWPTIHHSDGCYVAEFVQKALAEGSDPFKYSAHHGFQGYLQIDACRPPGEGNFCIFPQVFALNQITAYHPNAYYLMTKRASLAQHAASMNAWANMLHRFGHFGFFSMFPKQSTNNSLIENGMLMIEGMEDIVRSYFLQHPEYKYLEVCLEDPKAAGQLAAFFGIPSFPLFHANHGNYHGSRTPSPTHQHTFAPS